MDPPFDTQRPGGHLSELDTTRASVLDGSIAADHVREMPGVALKAYYKTRSTNPSYEERKRLANELLGANSEEKLALIDRWFSVQRMEDFVKEDARKQRQEAAPERNVSFHLVWVIKHGSKAR